MSSLVMAASRLSNQRSGIGEAPDEEIHPQDESLPYRRRQHSIMPDAVFARTSAASQAARRHSRTDADLDAFLLDYFPETKKQCTDRMTRIQKLNLLLEKEDASEILNALHSKRPQLCGEAALESQHSKTLVQESSRNRLCTEAKLSTVGIPRLTAPPRYFLHLSDLHFSDENQADQWHAQLLLDMRKQMKIRAFGRDCFGDITNHATVEQFGFAQDFFRQLCTSFRVARERLILVPGNHDVNWKLTDASQDGFSPFAAFYRSVTGSDYPSSPAQQTTLHHFPDLKLLVLGCNSACQIDRANPGRAGLHKEPLERPSVRW